INMDEKHKKKIGDANRGRIPSEETKRKISVGTKKAMANSKLRKKLSILKKGKPSTFKGKHHTEETKEKIRRKLKGRKCSKKHIKNISKGHIGIFSDTFCVT
ncbi:hypothetical protein LCGC14_2707290, partial [marine sediment metagenome]